MSMFSNDIIGGYVINQKAGNGSNHSRESELCFKNEEDIFSLNNPGGVHSEKRP